MIVCHRCLCVSKFHTYFQVLRAVVSPETICGGGPHNLTKRNLFNEESEFSGGIKIDKLIQRKKDPDKDGQINSQGFKKKEKEKEEKKIPKNLFV